MQSRAYILSLILAITLSAQAMAGESAAAGNDASDTPRLATDQLIKGMWVWSGQYIFEPDQQDELLAFCQRHGINRLLVQIHYAPSSTPPVIQQPDRYAELIAKAAGMDIAIEALDGEKSMALSENQPRTLAVLDAILELNKALPQGKRFVGVHYDIEPYLLEDWSDAERRPVILKDLLDYYVLAKERIHATGMGMTLSCDIPFWFDTMTSEDGLPLAVGFAGQTKPAQQHIQDICDYIGIMSYRRDATGPNSITGLVAEERAYAAKIGKKICAAVETGEYPAVPTISFYGLPASVFNENFSLAWQTLEGESGFGGMLIHCYPYVRHILEPDPDNEK